MEEFKFVLKCFLISCVVVVFSQARISGETLENKAFVFLQHSETAQWVRDAADGGVKMIRQGAEITKNFVSDKFGNSGSSSQRTVVIHRTAPAQEGASNTGLFRKLVRNPSAQQDLKQNVQRRLTQQRGMTAESDINSEENVDDQY